MTMLSSGRRRFRRSRKATDAPSVYSFLWDVWTLDQTKDVNWDRVVTGVQERPEIASFSDDYRRGMLLCHLVCALHPPPKALNVVLRANANASRKRSQTGLTPLHIACGRNASKRVIQVLVNHDPTVLTMADENGHKPLHYACREDVDEVVVHVLLTASPELAFEKESRLNLTTQSQSRHTALEILRQNGGVVAQKSENQQESLNDRQWRKITYILWAAHYGTLRARNGQTFSTFHAALAQNCTKDILDVALTMFGPEVCGVRDVHGNLPLHYAVSSSAIDSAFFERLIVYFPQAAAEKSSRGMLPLHEGLKQGKTWCGGLRSIALAFPAAISVEDPETGLYPGLLAAQSGCAEDTTTIFALLREFPQIIRVSE